MVVDGVRHTRCFSPCDSEHRADGRFTLTVKAHEGGVVSRELYDNARPGLMVDLEQAAGEFVLPRPRPHEIVLISGGSGITPVLAMARTLAEERHPGRVALLHYVSGPDDLVHAAELRRLSAVPGFTVTLGFTAVGGGDVRGHFTGGHLDVAAPWARGAQAFLCGPPALMEAVRGEYAERGLADSLHTEEFTLNRLGGDRVAAESVYAGVEEPLLAEDVADVIAYALGAPRHVNLDLITMRPVAQSAQHLLARGRLSVRTDVD